MQAAGELYLLFTLVFFANRIWWNYVAMQVSPLLPLVPSIPLVHCCDHQYRPSHFSTTPGSRSILAHLAPLAPLVSRYLIGLSWLNGEGLPLVK